MSQSEANVRSPWALHGYDKATIHPSAGPVDVTMRVPGSKSYTNRALILAGAARGTTVLRGILRSDDSYYCIETLKKLGLSAVVHDDVVTIGGCDAHWPRPADDLFIGSAGTTARFLPGLLAAGSGGPWTLDGSAQMRRRPVAPVIEALQALGGRIQSIGSAGALPLRIEGAGLAGGAITMSGSVSSQFISGVLMASPYARSATTVRIADHIVQHAYVMMTIDMMAAFGVHVEHDAELQRMHVLPQRYQGSDVVVEADASTAGYFFALAALTGGRVRITNLGDSTRQPDIKLVHVLERLGCNVTRGAGWLQVQGMGGRLKGGFTQNMKEMSDQALTVATLAVFADAPITITEVAHIRHHESDRIAAVCSNLRALGVRVDEHDDGLTVHPSAAAMHGCEVPSFDDHRIAMSMALIGVRVPGVVVQDPGCVSKTCPTFFDELRRAGVKVDLHTA